MLPIFVSSVDNFHKMWFHAHLAQKILNNAVSTYQYSLQMIPLQTNIYFNFIKN